jgi:DNA-binding NtrC family response regulator
MISSEQDNRAAGQQLHVGRGLGSGPERLKRVLLATTDLEIRQSIGHILQGYKIKTLLASGLQEIKSALTRNDIAACFCGFWLVDGTYRDVVRYLRLQRADIPVIVVCARTCSQEFRDYLSALNIRACDFISYPYREIDIERILQSSTGLQSQPAQLAT